MTTEANVSAYPISSEHGFPSNLCLGLTKREYFAAMAMQGILAHQSFSAQLATETNLAAAGEIATAAVNVADALITALNKQL